MSEKKTVKMHETEYWHIKRFALFPIAGLIIFAFLAYANFLRISYLWNVLELGNLFQKDLTSFSQLSIIPSFLLEYALISGIIVSFTATIKGGYEKLKPVNEAGLLGDLLAGLVFGLVFGLVGGLLAGLVFGLLNGLVGGLLAGLVGGLVAGLLFALVFALLFGLVGGLVGGLVFGLLAGLVFGLVGGLLGEFN